MWASQPSDPRALQRGVAAGRIAATWYTPTSYTLDVQISDGNSHQVSLYNLDWDNNARTQRVDILDGDSGNVLDSRTVTDFNGGRYLVWNISGHVVIRVTNTGSNAVLSGIFFDSVAGPTYSVSGVVTRNGASLSGVNLIGSGAMSCGTSDAAGQYTCIVPQGGTGTVTPSLSGYSFVPPSRSYSNVVANQTAQNYAATFTATPVPTTTTLSSASNPAPVGGNVVFTATVSGANPTGSVNFTDGGAPISGCSSAVLGGGGNTKTATCSASSLALGNHSIVASYSGDGANVASGSATLVQGITAAPQTMASFVGTDVTTQGNWKGVYGSNGYAIFNDSTNYPAYAQVTAAGNLSYVWASQPSDPRALQRGVAVGRIAATWYTSTSYTLDVRITDGNTHQVSLYNLDWDSTIRAQRVDILDGDSGNVVDSRTVTGFNGGRYLVWNISDHVVIRVTNTGSNAVLSGIFFDAVQ